MYLITVCSYLGIIFRRTADTHSEPAVTAIEQTHCCRPPIQVSLNKVVQADRGQIQLPRHGINRQQIRNAVLHSSMTRKVDQEQPTWANSFSLSSNCLMDDLLCCVWSD